MIKRIFFLSALLGLAALTASGTPLDKKRVGSDAKWVIHLDGDGLKKTKIGEYLLTQVLDKKSGKVKADLGSALGFELDWRKIRSLTAYGSTYQKDDPSGLLIIDSDLGIQQAMETALGKEIPNMHVEKLEGVAYPMFRLNNDTYLASPKKGLTLLSKSREAIEYGQGVIEGKKTSMAANDTLKSWPEPAFGFFFVGVANDFARLTKLPPNAAVLKQAEGGRIVLGEQDGQLRLNLDIRARSADVAEEIRKVAEGLIGLATLQASQNADLKLLTQSAKVSVADQLVTLGLQLPVADVIKKLSEKFGAAE